jgi:hypothetical protein
LQYFVTTLFALKAFKKQRNAVTLVARYTDRKAAYPGPYSLRTDAV